MRTISLYPIRRLRRALGFTVAEIIIIIAVISVLAAIALPSFQSMYESIKIDQAIAELRASISQSQRAAIRNGEFCDSSTLVRLQESTSSTFKSDVSSNCGVGGAQDIPRGVDVFSNLATTPMMDVIGARPTLIASSGVDDSGATLWASRNSNNLDDDARSHKKKKKKRSWTKWNRSNCQDWGGCSSSELRNIGFINFEYGRQGSINYSLQDNLPSSSGMVIVRAAQKPDGKVKCLAISQRIGLTRVGHYKGGLSPREMAEQGQCTAQEWNKQ